MHIDLVLPTHNRWNSLYRAVHSLRRGTYTDYTLHILLNSDHNGIPDWLYADDTVIHEVDPDIEFVARINACTSSLDGDIVTQITDTGVFQPDALEVVVDAMNMHFKDRMGVIGFDLQLARKSFYLWANRRYMDMLPRRYIYCPDYVHYSGDSELWQGADALNCFHLHHAIIAGCVRCNDGTHRLGQSCLAMDQLMMRSRRSMGYCWGLNFNLLKASK